MEASKKIVVGYAVHDIIGNNEQCLTEYDPEALRRAEDAGLIFVAQYDDGTREVVKAADVRKPDPTVNGIPLATAGTSMSAPPPRSPCSTRSRPSSTLSRPRRTRRGREPRPSTRSRHSGPRSPP